MAKERTDEPARRECLTMLMAWQDEIDAIVKRRSIDTDNKSEIEAAFVSVVFVRSELDRFINETMSN